MDFRQYDNTLGRFNVIDPLAEQDYGITPYHFGYNNPVLFGDPSGLKAQAPEGTENNIVQGSVLALYMSGKSPLEVRDYLEAQMWGPNFIVTHAGGGGASGGGGTSGSRYDGAGGVHLLTTNYKTGEVGYWTNVRTGGNQDSQAIDLWMQITGSVYIKPNYERIWISRGKYEFNYKNSLVDGFVDGFLTNQKSNQQSASAWLGYAGIHVDKYERLLKAVATSSSGWSNKVSALRAAKGLAVFGKSLGVVGSIAGAFEDGFSSDGFTFGDGVKLGIGLLTTFTPYGWVYGLVDVGVGLATGVTLSDRIGSAFDGTINAINN